MRLLAISGSLRSASTNTALLCSSALLAPQGTEVILYDNLGKIPIFNPDNELDKTPAEVLDFANEVDKADGLLISSPEYAHGVPGGIKNALDWLVSRYEIIEKPIMIFHASHRGDYARAALIEILTTISEAFITEASVTLPLLGKTPEEIANIIAQPDVSEEIRSKLKLFVTAIQSRQSKA